ncbi:recombinase family protein [Salmonella enterica subsp. enterica serovar Nigeria]|nr:recombinase family protein [Salmonella enterica subsp. enterica serovar Nigeria]
MNTPRVLAYLRASTDEQDADRARQDLIDFAASHGVILTADDFYSENVSGASLTRPELDALIKAAQPGTVLLIEQVDRLTRLPAAMWDTLKARLMAKQIKIVSLDMPTSHRFMKLTPSNDADDTEARFLDAINGMMLDLLAAIARKDYNDRRRRQAQGVERARAAGKLLGRRADIELYRKIKTLVDAGLSLRSVARQHGVALSTVQRAMAYWKEKEAEQAK